MAWGGGIFTRAIGNWATDKLTTPKITAARHDTNDDDFEAGINACLHKGGSNSPTASINWGGYNITNVGSLAVGTITEPSANAGVRLNNQVTANEGINYLGALSGGAMTVTLAPSLSSLVVGTRFHFLASGNWAAGSTININGTGATAVVVRDTILADEYAQIVGDVISGQMYSLIVNSESQFLLEAPGRGFFTVTPTISKSGAGTWTTGTVFQGRWCLLTSNLIELVLNFDGRVTVNPVDYLTVTLPTGLYGALGHDVATSCKLVISGTPETGAIWPDSYVGTARIYRAANATFPVVAGNDIAGTIRASLLVIRAGV